MTHLNQNESLDGRTVTAEMELDLQRWETEGGLVPIDLEEKSGLADVPAAFEVIST
jgi:hypothetical protein